MSKNTVLKLGALLIVLSMLLSLFACQDGNEDNTGDGTTQSKNEQTTETGKETDEPSGSETSTESSSDGSSDTSTDTESDTEQDSTAESGDGSTAESDSETETEESCHPKYASDASGHWSPACEICHKNAGKVRAHEVDLDIKDGGNVLLYRYVCKTCGYVVSSQRISYDIDIYIAPTDLSSAYTYGISPEYIFDTASNIGFARFTSGGSGAYINAYQNDSPSDPAGNYLVMKVRMNGGNGAFSLSVNTANAAGRLSASVLELGEGWQTLIIDLTKINSIEKGKKYGFVADSVGDYYVSALTIYLDAGMKLDRGDSLDISYMLICETLDEACEYAGAGTMYIYDNILANPFPTVNTSCQHKYTYTADGHSMQACSECGAEAVTNAPHRAVETADGLNYTYKCECGYAFESADKTLPNGVKYFLSPSYIAKHADSQSFFTAGELIASDGEAYARIYGKGYTSTGSKIDSTATWWNPISGMNIDTGRYMVIKYRAGKNGIGQTNLQMYISTDHSGATGNGDGIAIPCAENDEWNVAVIDLDKLCSAFNANDDGEYLTKFLQIRPFGWASGIRQEDDYNDIAYIAFVNDLGLVKSIVSESSYKYFDGTSSGGTDINTSQGPAAEETTQAPDLVVEETETVSDGIKYNYKHDCDDEDCTDYQSSITVPTQVNKFISPSAIANTQHFNIKDIKLMSNDGTAFVRLTSISKSGEYINVFSTPTSTGAAGAPAALGANSGRYFVFKYRVQGPSAFIIEFATDGNTLTSVEQNSVRNNGEWEIAVIDLAQFANYTTNKDNVTVQVRFTVYSSQDTHRIDLAWAAVVDSLDEIKSSWTGSDTYELYASWKDKKSNEVDAATGKCTGSHDMTETRSGTTCTYRCQICGEQGTKTVSANINKYISPLYIAERQHFNTTAQTLIDSGVTFVRLTSEGASHLHIWATGDGAGQPAEFGANTGTLLVIKYRASGFTALELCVGTGSEVSKSKWEPFANDASKWRVAVVDLSKLDKYEASADGKSVKIIFNGWTNGTSVLDVAYAAIVDNIDEVKEICDDRTYTYYETWGKNGNEVVTETGNCVRCTTKETWNGTTYTYSACTVCGAEFATKTVPDGVVKYWSANQLVSGSGYLALQGLYGSDGVAYGSISGSNGKKAYEWYPTGAKDTKVKADGAFKYLVCRVRKSDLDCEFHLVFDKMGIDLAYGLTAADEWVTVVIDTAKMIESDKFTADTDIKMWAYTNGGSLDIEYMAFCKDWTDVQGVAGSTGTCKLVTSVYKDENEKSGAWAGVDQNLAAAPSGTSGS